MPKETHFYDTIDATRNYDTTGGQTNTNYYHSYNVTFPLRSPLINYIKKCRNANEFKFNCH